MTAIELLEVFRTGRIGSIEIGASKDQVQASLGEPDDWWREPAGGTGEPYTAAESGLWVYGGLEFYWHTPDERLSEISFKPHYLYWSQWKTEIDPWIFRSLKGPSVKRLKSALKQADIPFQDTGLELYIDQHGSTEWYKVVPFQADIADFDPLDVFGTLVLKSGVQVRYGLDNKIIKTALGNTWGVKGSEQFIQWS